MNSVLKGIYTFWRSQNPIDKPHAPVDSRMLPSVVQVGGTASHALVVVKVFTPRFTVIHCGPAHSSAVALPILPLQACEERSAIGNWATALFCTIITCNLLGLVPFNEAPTSGLGFSTGLGVSVWATATALGLYKLGFTFPGHFIPGALSTDARGKSGCGMEGTHARAYGTHRRVCVSLV